MLSRLRNMFRVVDLRNKIFFTLFDHRHLPAGVAHAAALRRLLGHPGPEGPGRRGRGALEFLDLFSGGALTNVAVFALGIMPYITSSIIMQLLAVVIPKLEEWQQQGQVGQKKITQWTRYLTVALALMQSTGIVFALHQGGGSFLGSGALAGHRPDPELRRRPGHADRGHAHRRHGHDHVARRADHPAGHRQRDVADDLRLGRVPPAGPGLGHLGQTSYFKFTVVILMGIGMIVGIVFVEQGQRRIPVQFAKRVVGRRMYGGQSTYIPLKVNQSGVIPIIFASSVLYFPALITGVLPWDGVQTWVQNNIVRPALAVPHRLLRSPDHLLRLLLHGHRLQPPAAGRHHPQAGRVHPRHPAGAPDGAVPRPGPQPHHPARVAVPDGDRGRSPCSCSRPGTSPSSRSEAPPILITVGVALETMKQIDSQLMMRNYEGFLR